MSPLQRSSKKDSSIGKGFYRPIFFPTLCGRRRSKNQGLTDPNLGISVESNASRVFLAASPTPFLSQSREDLKCIQHGIVCGM